MSRQKMKQIIAVFTAVMTVGANLPEQIVSATEENMEYFQTIITYAERAAGHFYYNQLEQFEKAAQYKAFYQYLDQFCEELLSYDGELSHTEYLISFNAETPVKWSPDLSNLSYSDQLNVLNMYAVDHPYYFFINSAFFVDDQLNLLYEFNFDKAEKRREIFSELNSYIDSYSKVASIDAPYEQAKYLHDTLCLNMTYAYDTSLYPSDGEWTNCIYGAVFYKTGVCECYASTYQMLAQYYGLESACVNGTVDGYGHRWNIVMLDDDEYYYVDVTWDDALDETNQWSNQYLETYFTVGSAKLERDHTRVTDSEFFRTGMGDPLQAIPIPSLSAISYQEKHADDPPYIKGDVNSDGIFSVSDVVLLQKWLLAVPDTHLVCWKKADFYKDGRLNVFDLCLMKRALIKNNQS